MYNFSIKNKSFQIFALLFLFIICTFINFAGGFNYVNGKNGVAIPVSKYCKQRGPYFRYHRETKFCFQIGSIGPCGPKGSNMRFVIQDNHYGMCDCDTTKRCGRPLIYWPHTDHCYYAYSQGPCDDGKWFIFGIDGKPICRKNVCEDNEDESPSTTKSYWFAQDGKCFKTRRKGYCTGKSFLFVKDGEKSPSCQISTTCKNETGTIPQASCLQGQVLDYFGGCTPPIPDFI